MKISKFERNKNLIKFFNKLILNLKRSSFSTSKIERRKVNFIKGFIREEFNLRRVQS